MKSDKTRTVTLVTKETPSTDKDKEKQVSWRIWQGDFWASPCSESVKIVIVMMEYYSPL